MTGIEDFHMPQHLNISHPENGFFGYMLRCRCHVDEDVSGNFVFLVVGLGFEQVADFGEQRLLLGGLGGCGLLLLGRFLELVHEADGHEDAEGDDKEVDDALHEHTPCEVDLGVDGLPGGGQLVGHLLGDDIAVAVGHVAQDYLLVGEVDTSGDQGHQRHDHIVDQ